MSVPEKSLKIKTRLVFWQLFHIGYDVDDFHSPELLDLFQKNGLLEVPSKNTKKYRYFDEEGQSHELGWLAKSSDRYLPLTFRLVEDQFETHKGIRGSIIVETHLHYGGCVLFDCKFDFASMYTIQEYVVNSVPTEILLLNQNMTLWDYFETKLNEIKQIVEIYCKTNLDTSKKDAIKIETDVCPWHHTWIIKGTEVTDEKSYQDDQWQKDFEVGGKYFKHALGLTQRADDWYAMRTEFFEREIQNLSPYENSAVYITNAGNVIVPNKELTDTDSMKNKLVDVIFATEMGNVQRFLALVHVTSIVDKMKELQKKVEEMRAQEEPDLNEIADKVRALEIELNRISLEIGDDLMITRVPRLMFTSILKLTLFRIMIERLHGNEYREAMNSFLVQMKETVAREREMLETLQHEKENTLLKNLQIVFIISLAAEVIALFFYDPTSTHLDWGSILFIASLMIAIIVFGVIRASTAISSKLRSN
ncbi:MAG: hypothetical protein GF411_07635 [Candidatus Lokiarchaeota archaeon]|nr:hypothetical protein [Candidatus Lokiarchaeota archaeon]